MNKLAKLINSMNLNDLRKIRKDLVEGNFLKLIDKRLTKLQDPNKVCPICGSNIDENSIEMVFGREGLRKRATFCGHDCLEFFINDMKRKNLKI